MLPRDPVTKREKLGREEKEQTKKNLCRNWKQGPDPTCEKGGPGLTQKKPYAGARSNEYRKPRSKGEASWIREPVSAKGGPMSGKMWNGVLSFGKRSKLRKQCRNEGGRAITQGIQQFLSARLRENRIKKNARGEKSNLSKSPSKGQYFPRIK